MSTRDSRKRIISWTKKLLTLEMSLKKLIWDLHNLRVNLDQTLSNKEPNILKKKEQPLLRRRKISSCKQTKWTCHSQKQEKDFKTVSNKTMQKSNKWTKKQLRSRKWLINIIKMSRKLTKIWKKRTPSLEKSKNTKSCIKKKRKSMNLLSNLRLRKFSMKKRLKRTNTWLHNFLSTCKKQWPDKTSYQLRNKLRTWAVIWNSSRDSLKMLRILLLGWEFRRSKFRTIWTRLRIWREEFIRKWSRPRRKSESWKMKCKINSPKLKICRSNSKTKKRGWAPSRSSSRYTKMALPSKSPITLWSMTPRKIRFCKVRFTIDSMRLRKSSSKTSLKSTLFSNTLKVKVLRATISISSKTACNSVMRSTWILSRDAWA